ncbi:MAG: phosphate-starvation-inducible PsiE family protein [Betaproteobacteria bacterium]|nr:phosphate-starvation-inducible PsiE family protein [Betaproteobacteria bacterium]
MRRLTAKIITWYDGALTFGVFLLSLVMLILMVSASYRYAKADLVLPLRLGKPIDVPSSTVDFLSIFVLIELARIFFGYFQSHRIRLRLIIDAGLVFLVRDTVIEFYAAHPPLSEVLPVGLMLAILMGLRIASIIWSPGPSD